MRKCLLNQVTSAGFRGTHGFFLCILFYFLPVLGLPCPVGVSLQLPEPGLLCRCGAREPLMAVSSPVAVCWLQVHGLQVRYVGSRAQAQ